MAINVVIADDHSVVREGLRLILSNQPDIHVTGEAADGHAVIALCGSRPCDVIIMDIAMAGLNGIEATRTIRQKQPEVKVIILSMHDSSEHVYRAFQAGACGYLLKGVTGAEVITAIHAVMQGEVYVCQEIEAPRPEKTRAKSPLDSLSQREWQVLQLVAEGKSGAEIGKLLSIGENTSHVYLGRIMKKLKIDNSVALIKFAIQHGITSLE